MKTRIEIFTEVTGIDIEYFIAKDRCMVLTPEKALEAMTRFAELAFEAGWKYGYEPMKESFNDWLSQQEGGSNGQTN